MRQESDNLDLFARTCDTTSQQGAQNNDVMTTLPLAARLRPTNLTQYVGQQHLVGKGKVLSECVQTGNLHSMILWGPPGTGKTTLARLLTHNANAVFEAMSAVMSGVKDIRAIIERARFNLTQHKKTVVFVDEVHRFNKAQQDAFLPYIEDGTIIFIGATTENPSFEVNNALLSRTRVHILKMLTDQDLQEILIQALTDQDRGLGKLTIDFPVEQQNQLVQSAQGDARRLLNWLETLVEMAPTQDGKQCIDIDTLQHVLGSHMPLYDKNGDAFYDLISAFHKSVRGSSPDGALYWMARIINAGGDPLYVARRLLAIASEDIGNADPRALQITLNAWDIFERVGSAEGNRAIAQAAIYCACAPKSNAVYCAYQQALTKTEETGHLGVPTHLRNAPTQLMKTLKMGADYRYAHDEPDAYAAGQTYFPDVLGEQQFYHPTDRGLEQKLAEKLQHLRDRDKMAQD